MRIASLRALLRALLLALAAAGPASAAAPLIPAGEVIPVSKIHRGMRGYGLTVFQGTRIDRFDVQVIDILRQDYMGNDMILIRMHGGPITGRGANIIGGMSGSPIYLDGRLAGAVSMGWTFPKEPVAIVTPIEAMSEALDPHLPQRPLLTSVWDAAGAEPAALLPYPGTGRGESDAFATRPTLMTPIFGQGLSAAGIRRLGRIVSPYGMTAAAGGGGQCPVADIPFRGGSGVGVYFVTGDIQIGGFGTLTYRKGNRVLGFGHPMFQIGAVDIPMTTVYVQDVACSMMRSNKLGSMGKVVGSVVQDRPFSIAGVVGRMPGLVPVQIGVRDGISGRSRLLNVNVVNHPMLTGDFIGMAASEAILRVRNYPGESMARVQLRVEADGLPPIVRKNTSFDYFDPNGYEYASLRDLNEILRILSGNPFGQVPIRRVRLDVTIGPGRKTAALERVAIDRDRVEPGEKVRVSAVLRPWHGTPEVRTLEVKVPAGAPEGRAVLAISGGASSLAQRPSGMGGGFIILGGGQSGGGEPVSSVAQMIQRWQSREQNTDVTARLYLPSPSVSVRGERLLGLPAPLADVMRSPKATGSVSLLEEVKSRLSLDRVVTGAQAIPITIQRRSLSERRAGAPAPQPVPTSQAPLPPELQGRVPGYLAGEAGPEALSMVASEPAEPRPAASAPPAPAPAPNPQPEAQPAPPAPPSPSGASSGGPRKRPGRQTLFWTQRSAADWQRGENHGTAVTTDGAITLAPSLQPLHLLPQESMVWAVAAGPKGDLYLGTGVEGRIYRRSPEGKVSILFDAPETTIQALAVDGRGNLYAGTAQGGLVYRIAPDGKASVLYRTGERFVLSLAVDGTGNVYAGTGGSGRIYRIDPSGKGSLYFRTPEAHVLRLLVDGKGRLLAGTADDGVVYRITAPGQGEAILDTGDKSVGGLAVDAQGRVVAATAPRGLLLREGRAKPLYEARTPSLALALGPDKALYAGAGANLFRLDADDAVARLEYRDQGQILGLTTDPGGRLWAATGNGAGLYRLEGPRAQGSYESVARDVEAPARWGRLSWEATVPPGASVALQTRAGSTAEPDASWSPWSAECTASGASILGPPGRYVQYRLSLRAGKGGASPEVKSVTLSYLPENRAPEVEWRNPLVGSAVSGKPSLAWTGGDPDRDTVTYELFTSGDGGGTWQQMQPAGPDGVGRPAPFSAGPGGEPAKNGPASAPAAGAAPGKASDTPMAPQRVPSGNAPAPSGKPAQAGNAPAPVGAAPSAGTEKPAAPQPAPPAPAPAPRPEPPKPGPVTGTSFRWDAQGLADGPYLIKIVASDARSNPGDARTAERVVGPILVSNAKPKITVIRATLICDTEGRVCFRGRVEDPRVPIASISYRVDGGEWLAATPADAMLDSAAEEFTVATDRLPPGKHVLEVEAVNLAEGSATETVEVK